MKQFFGMKAQRKRVFLKFPPHFAVLTGRTFQPSDATRPLDWVKGRQIAQLH
jgi:hypothetical protein